MRAEDFAVIIPSPPPERQHGCARRWSDGAGTAGRGADAGRPVGELAPWDARMIEVEPLEGGVVRVRMASAEALRRSCRRCWPTRTVSRSLRSGRGASAGAP